MLECLKYINHMNEVFEFGKNGIFVDGNDLHDYEWNTVSKGKRISNFDHVIRKKKLPVVIMCDTEEKGIAARNRLMEVAEKDVLAMKPGRIVCGDYYYRCYVTKSQKKKYQTSKRYMEANLTLTSDHPVWIKETIFSFRSTGSVGDDNSLDYPYDYPHDYLNNMGTWRIYNPDIVATNFRMIIYGACNNPTVHIGNHRYKVNCHVGSGEYLVIDSVTKTITLTSNDGTTVNVFNDRDRESYIFEKIAPGTNVVSRGSDVICDIILLEERSEPKWN